MARICAYASKPEPGDCLQWVFWLRTAPVCGRVHFHSLQVGNCKAPGDGPGGNGCVCRKKPVLLTLPMPPGKLQGQRRRYSGCSSRLQCFGACISDCGGAHQCELIGQQRGAGADKEPLDAAVLGHKPEEPLIEATRATWSATRALQICRTAVGGVVACFLP